MTTCNKQRETVNNGLNYIIAEMKKRDERMKAFKKNHWKQHLTFQDRVRMLEDFYNIRRQCR